MATTVMLVGKLILPPTGAPEFAQLLFLFNRPVDVVPPVK